MNVPFSFFYDWTRIPEEMYPNLMREFRDNGVRNLVIGGDLLEKIIKEPRLMMNLRRQLKQTGMRFFEVHGLWGAGYDLVCTDRFRRPGMIAEHKLAMACAAEAGCRTYVVHIGAYESVYFGTPNAELRPNGIDALEQLLPEAEKLGLVIAVENSFEISNTPDEVLYYVNHFQHPAVAVCFDVGHANIMAPGPGKTQEKYSDGLKYAWRGHVVQYDRALEKLAPHVVTMHLHDNSGFNDDHALPGQGTVDWAQLTMDIKKLPRLLSLQCEVSNGPAGDWSIRRICETFQRLFPDNPMC